MRLDFSKLLHLGGSLINGIGWYQFQRSANGVLLLFGAKA